MTRRTTTRANLCHDLFGALVGGLLALLILGSLCVRCDTHPDAAGRVVRR